MNDIWIVSIPILLVDVVSPVLLAATTIALTGGRPVANSLALVLGHTAAYFAVGVLIIYGLAELIAPVINFVVDGFVRPTRINFVIGLLLGIVLVAVALRIFTHAEMIQPAGKSTQNAQKTGVLPSFAMGVTICAVGIPFAVPYFGFINELYRFDVQSKLAGLLIYNMLYALPFAAVPLGYALMGDSVIGRLNSLNRFITSTGTWFVPLLFGVLGLAFIADAIKYFATGSGLI
ncbi:MAG: GAP family protein [Ruegeria sp.]